STSCRPPRGKPSRDEWRAHYSNWTNFAAAGDPNGPGLPAWRAYRGDGRPLSLAAGAGSQKLRRTSASARRMAGRSLGGAPRRQIATKPHKRDTVRTTFHQLNAG